jgi:geranylgeranyl pyrophosphate synthase
MDAFAGADFVEEVRALAESRIARALSPVAAGGTRGACGKMLRTRLAARLAGGRLDLRRRRVLAHACAATEVVHTASLLHDDIIDGGVMRRGEASLWRSAGIPAAILLGDLLLCEAIALLTEGRAGRHLPCFVAKVGEVVEAEAAQELVWRGRRPDGETLLRLARGKTGPLFAFAARACGDGHAAQTAFEEAGYLVGTAYQLADDLLDVAGCEKAAGKTLGTDARRAKPTFAQIDADGASATLERISQLWESALGLLEPHAAEREGLRSFIACDMKTVLERIDWRFGERRGIPA